jgi:flagellar biosynthesis protein FlhF
MNVRTYRARNMLEALNLVRRELGPDAAILNTREVHGGPLLRWIPGLRQIEITAALDVHVPSRLAPRERRVDPAESAVPTPRNESFANHPPLRSAPRPLPSAGIDLETKLEFRDEVRGHLSELHSMVEDLYRRANRGADDEWPEGLFQLFTELLDADMPQEVARDLVNRVRAEAPADLLGDPALLRARVARLIELDIPATGSIEVTPGRRRLVALVGPTGVGKTTTIAKLAANSRLRDKHRVGLITVDTYRIAAVEQLRTYADIIDLPMEVVSSPREMREAVARLSHLDLVLLDTAGRSPTDEIKIQELRAFLGEAGADEVHLVLSSAASSRTLERTVRQFAVAGVTHLIMTKLDEAAGLGNLLPVLRGAKLPVSYLTHGQNVPDDITPATAGRLSSFILDNARALV